MIYIRKMSLMTVASALCFLSFTDMFVGAIKVDQMKG